MRTQSSFARRTASFTSSLAFFLPALKFIISARLDAKSQLTNPETSVGAPFCVSQPEPEPLCSCVAHIQQTLVAAAGRCFGVFLRPDP